MPIDLKVRLSQSAFAFRGYNVTNLGRTPELLEHPKFGPVVCDYLQQGSHICSEVTGYKTDLVSRVREQRETDLSTYHEALSMVVAVELAQIQLLKEFFDIDVCGKMAHYTLSFHGAQILMVY